IGGNGDDQITCMTETSDGGYIVGGYFTSSSIELENGDILNNNGNKDGMIIKYDKDGEIEWSNVIGGNKEDNINCIVETSNGEYIVGGYFYSDIIDLGNEIVLTSINGRNEGMIIKYENDGNIKSAQLIGGTGYDNVYTIEVTSDGGYIVGGNTTETINLENGEIINSHGNEDLFLIKYNEKEEIEWSKTIGGSNLDRITCIKETKDNGYVVGGYFLSRSIDLGNGIELINKSSSGAGNDGMVIKYDNSGNLQWAKVIGGTDDYDYIKALTETNDGGFIAAGEFAYCDIELDNGEIVKPRGSSDIILIKYDKDGKVEWVKQIGANKSEKINCIKSTNDGGFIIGGYTDSVIDVGNGIILGNNGLNDGIIIKYDKEGQAEWGRNIGGNNNDYITCIAEKTNGEYIIGGYFESKDIELSEDNTITNQGGQDGMIIRIREEMGVPEIQELVVENIQKEFRITTKVQEIDGIKGGTISSGEQLKYGQNSTKEILIIPSENYEIIGITINGKEHKFTTNEDGTYTMPKFENVTEDKKVEVTFALKDNKITINKVDSKTKLPLAGAKFRLDQIEERTNPENVIGEIVENGEIYVEADKAKEVKDVLGELTNNGEYHFINQDGKYVPTNSKTYQDTIGGTRGGENVTANSYIEIDLRGKEGKYAVVVNARHSSGSYDWGYATIANTNAVQRYSDTTGQFIKEYGVKESKDYMSGELLGGNIYYLHLGYYQYGDIPTNEDQVVFNSIKVYELQEKEYNFINNKGKYESNNQGKDDTVANSYIPIDLTNNTGKYNLTVNAQISSENNDYGYATITENTTRPAYNNTNGRLIYITGEQVAKDYTTVLQGGKMYYLHLGYYKNGTVSTGEDKFTVNAIKITLNDSELYHAEVESNNEGQIVTQIPFGKYSITEIKAPEGYNKIEEPIIIEFRADENHEFTIENDKKAKVTTNHYKAIKNEDGSYTYTEEKLTESDNIEGNKGDKYTTIPHLDLEKYELIKNEEGEYIIPENATGEIEVEDIIVNYYYVEKEIPLIIHHYIEGTTQRVLLKNGQEAQDIKRTGKENTEYITSEIIDEELSEQYELGEVPENARGIYIGEEIIVTYYYKKVKREVVINKYSEDGITPLEEVKFTVRAKKENEETSILEEIAEKTLYTTNKQGKIKLELEAGRYEIKEEEAPYGYQISENPIQEIEVTKETEIEEIEITNAKKRGTVITHHYIEGTEEKIVEDVIQEGIVGELFATKISEAIPEYYENISSSEKTSGEYLDEIQEVIYYYKLKEYNYTVEYYYNGIKDEDMTETLRAVYGSKIEKYISKEKEGYIFEKEENKPLSITENEASNVIKVYYVKRQDLSYTVNYLEKDTNKVIKTQKVEENQIFESIITAESQKVEIEGYNYDSSDKENITIGTEASNNLINLYYTKRRDLSYTVNYLEKDTDKVLRIQKVEGNQIFETVITAESQKVEIDGYNYDSSDKENITIRTEESNNVINLYYTKRRDLSYTVNYLEKDTNKVIKTQKIEGNQIFETIITSENQKIEIDGYNYDSSDKENITIGTEESNNVINLYYTKRTDLSYTVNYLEKNTNKVLRTQKVEANQIFETIITAESQRVEIDGYNYDSSNKENITIGTKASNNVINLYYTKRTDLSYTINYLEKDTNKVINT
ncbi:MAG: MucBP domain-containing protein, partial [Lachnospiraceae bacterium]|nr:MucBP domain-containing protein [Lachnospiraceae bacterium]